MKLAAAQYEIETRLASGVELCFVDVRAKRQQFRPQRAQLPQTLKLMLQTAGHRTQIHSDKIKAFVLHALQCVGIGRHFFQWHSLPLCGALDMGRNHQIGRNQQHTHEDHALAAGRPKLRDVRRRAARYLLRMSR